MIQRFMLDYYLFTIEWNDLREGVIVMLSILILRYFCVNVNSLLHGIHLC